LPRPQKRAGDEVKAAFVTIQLGEQPAIAPGLLLTLRVDRNLKLALEAL
jgi:hypothetical protein